jgi:hypothetical protein
MAVYATWSDVEAAADHSFTEEEIRRTEALLDRAEALLYAKVDLDELVDSGATTPENVAYVEAAMVERVLRNPGGIRQETVGAISTTFSESATPGSFQITRDDWLLLGVPSIGSAGTIPLEDPALPVCIQTRYPVAELSN